MMRTLLVLVYLLIGLVVAQQHHFLDHLDSVSHVVSAALALVAWPAVLAGVNLHVRITTGN